MTGIALIPGERCRTYLATSKHSGVGIVLGAMKVMADGLRF